MDDESMRLMQRISALPDEDLLRMVNIDFAQYRIEALTYARAEIAKRHLSVAPPDTGSSESVEYSKETEQEVVSEKSSEDTRHLSDNNEIEEAVSTVRYKVFRGTLTSWDSLFSDAARFASRVGRGRVIGISQSEDSNEGVVVVWYWS